MRFTKKYSDGIFERGDRVFTSKFLFLPRTLPYIDLANEKVLGQDKPRQFRWLERANVVEEYQETWVYPLVSPRYQVLRWKEVAWL